MLDEKWGRQPFHLSRAPFTCGLSGTQYSIEEVRDRVNALARSLSKELGWHPNQGTEWDKVVGVFSVNTVRLEIEIAEWHWRLISSNELQIDTMTLTWAIHSLSGISSPANAAYSESEIVYQLKSSGAKALFTCLPLLQTSIAAAAKSGIQRDRIYLFDLPKEVTGGASVPKEFKTVDQLIKSGASLPPLEKLRWTKGQGARQTAFLCYSSGTSGLPVRISTTKTRHQC